MQETEYWLNNRGGGMFWGRERGAEGWKKSNNRKGRRVALAQKPSFAEDAEEEVIGG
jgi:hypothetical protein